MDGELIQRPPEPIRDHELEPWRGFMLLRSGGYVDPALLGPADVRLLDLAWAQGHLCRFTGHARQFYSVAEHAVLVGKLMRSRGGNDLQVLAALVHDAAEAYLGDVGRPVKRRLGNWYAECEDRLSGVIDEFFSLNPLTEGERRALKDCDNAVCGLELQQFWPGHPVLAKTRCAEPEAELVIEYHRPRLAARNWLLAIKPLIPSALLPEWSQAMERLYS